MILAGDVGGTKCNLGLFETEELALHLVFQRKLATRDYAGFDALLEDFLKMAAAGKSGARAPVIEGAGFGVAGVVVDGRHYSENLPWVLDAASLRRKLNLKNVILLNDLAATAFSLEQLPADDLAPLNVGVPELKATRAVIAAGTGLGEAILFWDGEKYQVAAAEGGQAAFAPRTEREIQLLRHLMAQLEYVSSEEIVSGRGFRRIHEFLDASVRHSSFEAAEGSAAGEIVQRGLEMSCLVCAQTVEFWVEIFGGLTGNFALQTMALGGIYIAGGIAAKILPRLRDGTFFKAFCGASKLAPVLQRVPILVLTNEDAPMWGAAYQALLSAVEKGKGDQ